MRGGSLLFISSICCLAAHAFPHGHNHDEDPEAPFPTTTSAIHTIPTNETGASAKPTIAYIPPGNDVKDTHSGMDMDMDDVGGMDEHHHHNHTLPDGPIPPEEMSYWLWSEHRGLLYAHISLMIISWGFVLPVGMLLHVLSANLSTGVMLGVAQSAFHIPVQIAFLTLTTIGVVFAIMYNSATPDFYENNAHHKIGWVIVWMLVAQVVSGMIRGVARYVNGDPQSRDIADQAEHMFMLGDDHDEDDENEASDENEIKRPPGFRRNSSDSGNGTGESTPRGGSTSSAPSIIRRSSENTLRDDHERNFHTVDTISHRNPESKMEKYLAKKLRKQRWLNRIGRRGAFIAKIVHGVIGRPLFLLGFLQLSTGVATVTGIFKANDIYNGLAHFIKGTGPRKTGLLMLGGIFFNYGVITLGRYLGVFADLGWAWNLKPPGAMTGQKWKDRAPSAEFVESFFICIYGASQSFMEHLGSNDGIWSHKDLEHVSIAIMFFWAGLCGLLIETPFVRRAFNRTIEATFPVRTTATYQRLASAGSLPANNRSNNAAFAPPAQQAFSFNPFPGLIIFMTGIMMSMHHQESMLSTMVHKQWGYLLAAFALFRLGTYFLMFLSPPKSYIPSRPVTELLTSFCLICGGMVFMVNSPFS